MGDVAMGDVVVGLDVGTTRVKAVAFEVDVTGGARPRRWSVQRASGVAATARARQEVDPAVLVAAVHATLADLVEAVGGRAVVAVGVSTAMHGLVGLDDRLRATGPLLGWGDHRAAAAAASLRADPAAMDALAPTGTPVHPMSPLVKLRWLAEHDRTAHATPRWWVGTKEVVLLALSGDLVVDESSASGSGLLDVAARTWNDAALAVAGIDADRLARVVAGSTVLALSQAAAAATGISSGTPVVAGGADGPLANLGTGATAPGVAACSIGTSAAFRVTTRRPVVDAGSGLFCYVLDDDRWVTGAALSNGGSAAMWAAEALYPDLSHDAPVTVGPDPTGRDLVDRSAGLRQVLDRAAAVRAGCDGLAVLPYLTDERSPLDASGVHGTVIGLSSRHTRDHLTRAVVEGVARQVAWLAARVDEREAVHEVRATGGALDHPLWSGALAAALPWPVRTPAAGGTGAVGSGSPDPSPTSSPGPSPASSPGPADGSVVGAAALAWVAVGGAPDPDAAVAFLAGRSGGFGPPVPVAPETRRALEATDVALRDQLAALASLATPFWPHH